VKYRNLDDESEHEVLIGAAEAGSDPKVRALPLGSPVARALLGATKGTVVSATVAGAAIEIEVVDVQAVVPSKR
jgi:transcription elongation GreA/GreB family factor